LYGKDSSNNAGNLGSNSTGDSKKQEEIHPEIQAQEAKY
jgi:hypothetical protein